MASKACYNYYQAMSAATNFSIPLATAYGYPSHYIIVVDAISALFSATGATTANGGTIRLNLKVNGTATGNNIFAQTSDVWYTATGAASGVNMGGFARDFTNGLPLNYGGAGTATNPSIAVTAARVDFTTSGNLAAGGAAVDFAMSWHYEDPSERR